MPDVAPLLASDPAQVAGHRLTGRIGAGGQGVVYLGISPDNELVAVKLLRVEDDRSREQFAKEVASARRVAPFCTAQILDFDMESQPPYVISEFIEGPSLQQYVAERGPLSGTRLQRLAIGTATALAAIHQAGVVHRDLKPANVMMSPEGPRVIDFGIARDLSNDTTKVSKLFGTPAYMSPEQLRGERVGPATDLFAWGSVMAFAATGRAPFEAEHMMAAINKIANEQPDLTGVPSELLAVLRQCFSKDASQRPSAQHALSMLLGRPDESDSPDATVVLAEATQLVVASSTGPTAGYASGPTVADQNARQTQVHRPQTIGETRVDRPLVAGAASTGTSGPVSPGVPSGDVPPWGTHVPSGGQPRRPSGSGRPGYGQQNGPAGQYGSSGQPGRPSGPVAPGWNQQQPNGYQPVQPTPAQNPQWGPPQNQPGWGGQGQSGNQGRSGQPGQPGGSGQSAQQGQPGPSGQASYQGQPGHSGRPGESGHLGSPNHFGHPGSAGTSGQPGRQGHPGQAGQPGYSSQPGQQGRPGASGQESTPGQYGQQSHLGQAGQPGPPSPQGRLSSPGQPSHPGHYGQQSHPGPAGRPSSRERPSPPGEPSRPGQYGQQSAHGQPGHQAYQGQLSQQSSFGQQPYQGQQGYQRAQGPAQGPLPPMPAPGQRAGNGGPALPSPPPLQGQGWGAQQGWGGANGGGPSRIPGQRPGTSANRRRGAVLGGAAAVLTLFVGAGIWSAAQNDETTGTTDGTSAESGGGKNAADPETCGGRINVGADQGDGEECGAAETSDNSGSSDSDSDKVAPVGTLPYGLEGTWEGEVAQPSGSTQNWTVRLELKGGKKRAGTMEAVDLGCVSKVMVKNAGYNTATLRAPVKDKDNPGGVCAKLGEVILLQDLSDPEKATFTWKDANNAGNVGLAELTRVD